MKIPKWAAGARAQWSHTGRQRPHFAVDPAPGQESVWDYPRPPRIERDERLVVVRDAAGEIARSHDALRLLETASPPTYYLPPAAIAMGTLLPHVMRTRCEWKGEAHYWSLASVGAGSEPVAWSYPEPFSDYAQLRDHLAFYPGRVACTLGGEAVRPQPGRFYAGWITDEIVGPFKGDPGSDGW